MTKASFFQVFILLVCLTFATFSTHARWVVINSIPNNAKVEVNDREAGTTPIRLEGQDEESVTIRLSIESYNDFSFAYTFSENKVIFIDLVEGLELDEETYWEKETQSKTTNLKTIMPTVTPEPSATPEPEMIPPSLPVLSLVPDLKELPDDLMGSDEKGLAVIHLNISDSGKVKKTKLKTDIENKDLRRYLEDWVAEWSFDPATEEGQTTEGDLEIKIIYNMESGLFELPDHDIAKTVDVPETEVVVVDNTPEPTPVPDTPEPKTSQTVFYTSSQVDRDAKIFTPPSLGNIPVEIINMNKKGMAEFKVYVQPGGDIAQVDVVNSTGDDSLDKYIMSMIQKSFWEPAKKGGNAVGFTRNVTVDYYTTACRFDYPDLYE